MGYTKEQREKKNAELKEQAKASIIPEEANVISEENNTEVNTNIVLNKEEHKEDKQEIKLSNIPTHATINVRSNVFGELIYVSKRSGMEIHWNDTKTPIPMTIEELLIMRNSQIRFFKDNQLVVDGFIDSEYSDLFSPEDIYAYLQVNQYYNEFVCPDDIDSLFNMSPEQIKQKISTISKNKRELVIIRANELIENGILDSIKVVKTLEEALNCELLRKDDNEVRS